MKQVLQSLKNGDIEVAEVPAPLVRPGHLLIETTTTLVSSGTERMLLDFGKAGWIAKAQQQPDKVRDVLRKVRSDGLAATVDAVRSKLDQPIALGYCNVGRVIAVGSGVEGFSVGDRVASNGNHAGVVVVPKNLCARIPDGVDDEAAAFTILGAIGLQGIRLAAPTLGEAVVVTGLGLIGLLTVQMLRAQGCRVLGIDPDPERRTIAERFGAETVAAGDADDVLAAASRFSRGRGVDAVVITASTKSNDPVTQAAQMSRKRGRIILVGVTGLELSRADFFEKELSFQVSCSYGPGRYDAAYEEKGQDYPVGFVRWTEQRNFEAVLDQLHSGALDVAPLISHRFDINNAGGAFEVLTSDRQALGILLGYPVETHETGAAPNRVALSSAYANGKPSIAMIGAGNYGSRVLIPAFRKAGAELHSVVSSGGLSALHHGRSAGASEVSTDFAAAIAAPGVDTVVLATRHDAHARQVVAALGAGKHVFCEKPLCLTLDELADIEAALRPDARLMLGFNRRFAPHTIKMKQLLDSVSAPKSLILTVNAGAIPANHWTQDRQVGGGRLIGEACHFIDLARHLVGHPILSASAIALGDGGAGTPRDDKVAISLSFADGSIATIHYLANGDKSFPKERIEAFAGGRVLQLDNFLTLTGWGWSGFRKAKLWKQDKGQEACVAAFVAAVRNPDLADPIAIEQQIEVSRIAIELAEGL